MGAKLGGGGGKKYDLGQNSEINVTPFVDVMLVLLIIFMVAAPMATVSIAIDLPPAVPNPDNVKPKEPVFISIQKSGALFIADKQTRLENLSADIPAAMAQKGVTGNFQEERVFVRADADVQYEQFMAVLNVLQENGYFKIGLINEDIE
ncbi:biopolymer transporter ExbD [Caulobacter mirabilis]|uniref:Biopolymer transporter ExbD n=1 Tax=Caulobacter mirabilis TaxID=69666 RepID=A0A2D2ATA9_9CAUL|nr:biopolymer transporter ExbD [Caulobacter mirabilis]ATQ41226.1 biopolymer transporter ExbD [Caulobacter mirabilis]